MKILAVDLSTVRAGVAWLDDSRSREANQKAGGEISWPNDRKNSGQFFESLTKLVREFGLPEKIIVGLGPGSYAGVRIAISAAIGVQAAARAVLIGYPSVCAIAGVEQEYIVIGDARRKSFFFARIKNRTLSGEFELMNEDELRDRITQRAGVRVVSSDSLPQFQPGVELAYPSAQILAQLALDSGRKFIATPLQPIYLREAHVTIPKPIK